MLKQWSKYYPQQGWELLVQLLSFYVKMCFQIWIPVCVFSHYIYIDTSYLVLTLFQKHSILFKMYPWLKDTDLYACSDYCNLQESFHKNAFNDSLKWFFLASNVHADTERMDFRDVVCSLSVFKLYQHAPNNSGIFGAWNVLTARVHWKVDYIVI